MKPQETTSTPRVKRTSLDLINQVNRPFMFMGLKVEYAVIYFITLLLVSIKFMIVAAALLALSMPLLSRLNRQNKLGNPNYLKAIFNHNNLAKYYLDQKGLLKFLHQDETG